MAGAGPRLVAIAPELEAPGSDAPSAAPAARGVSRRSVGVVVLIAALLGVALAVQSRRVGELGTQVEGLTILARQASRLIQAREASAELLTRSLGLACTASADGHIPIDRNF